MAIRGESQRNALKWRWRGKRTGLPCFDLDAQPDRPFAALRACPERSEWGVRQRLARETLRCAQGDKNEPVALALWNPGPVSQVDAYWRAFMVARRGSPGDADLSMNG